MNTNYCWREENFNISSQTIEGTTKDQTVGSLFQTLKKAYNTWRLRRKIGRKQPLTATFEKSNNKMTLFIPKEQLDNQLEA